FFFQAEDGIRDYKVTGVQTCALPIYMSFDEVRRFICQAREAGLMVALAGSLKWEHAERLLELDPTLIGVRGSVCLGKDRMAAIRSEERRVGKEWRCRGALEHRLTTEQ